MKCYRKLGLSDDKVLIYNYFQTDLFISLSICHDTAREIAFTTVQDVIHSQAF